MRQGETAVLHLTQAMEEGERARERNHGEKNRGAR